MEKKLPREKLIKLTEELQTITKELKGVILLLEPKEKLKLQKRLQKKKLL